MKTAILLIALLADFPAVESWKPAGEVMTFDKQGLFKAINGAAPLYFSYGFIELRVRDFTQGKMRIAVNIYDMGTALGAYGIHRREHSSRLCTLLKDRFYVKIEALKGKLSAEACGKLTAALAAGLPGGEGPPAELKLLPEKRRVVGSVKFTPEGYLGLGELKNCLHAEYTGEAGKKYQVFVVISDGAWSALEKKWVASVRGKIEVLTREVPYRGLVAVARVGFRVYGVVDAGDATLDMLEQVVTEVQSAGVK
jgi:hypothetical protein